MTTDLLLAGAAVTATTTSNDSSKYGGWKTHVSVSQPTPWTSCHS